MDSEHRNLTIPVAVLGATGSVGQKFVSLLDTHPWFRIVAITASDRSAGKRYDEAMEWMQSRPLPAAMARMRIMPSKPPLPCPLVFSALDAAVAGPVEEAFARAGCLVVSNAKSHRYDPDVPLLIPEVNPDHLELARGQHFGGGAILTNPNCSTIGLVMALQPLVQAFGLDSVHVVSMQALSGAGLPGVPSFKMIDNIVPFIDGEEEKIERETRKILGAREEGRIREAEVKISAHCNRVPVLDGHTLCVSVGLSRQATLDEVVRAWESFSARPQEMNLPTAPARPLVYHRSREAPQPRLHRDLEGGMAVSIGRLRPCPLFDFKFVTLSHNTIRGAAGGALLVAELAVACGLLEEVPSFLKNRP